MKICFVYFIIGVFFIVTYNGVFSYDTIADENNNNYHELPIPPSMTKNEDWWEYQFEGIKGAAKDKIKWTNNRNCGPTSVGMVINYFKDDEDYLSSDYNNELTDQELGVITDLTSTSLTDTEAYWTPHSLKNLELKPNINQETTFKIVDNTINTISINKKDGDLTTVTNIGNGYAILYNVFSEMRWKYSQAYLHNNNIEKKSHVDWYKGYYNDWTSFNGYGAEEEQMMYVLELEDIKSHMIRGYDCFDEKGINAIENAVNLGKPCICLVNPIEYKITNRYKGSHWTVVYGYDDEYFYLNDPGWLEGEGYKAKKSDFSNALEKVNEISTIIIVDTLFAGTSGPGLVYRYQMGRDKKLWEPIATTEELNDAYAVLCLTEFEGDLYAGTMSTSHPSYGIGRVYRYEYDKKWTLVGDNMDDQVSSLAVYNEELYAGTSWEGMKLYKYEGGNEWTQVITPTVWYGTRALHVSKGSLFMGDIGWDLIGHWDGTFHQDQPYIVGSCIYDFEDFNDYIYASAYSGVIWRSSNGVDWESSFFGAYSNIWELESYGGFLFMSYGNGNLRASHIPDYGTLVCNTVDGIISMETDGINLYFGTGGESGAYYGSEIDGVANIYMFDLSNIYYISDWDEFGVGVQVLYIYN